MTSETAFTDSTSAYGESLAIVVPTSGGSKNTTSPSWSCAYQVMPSVAVSPSIARPVVLGVVLEVVGVAGLGHGQFSFLYRGFVRTSAGRVLAADVDLDLRCPARPCRPARRPCRCPTFRRRATACRR